MRPDQRRDGFSLLQLRLRGLRLLRLLLLIVATSPRPRGTETRARRGGVKEGFLLTITSLARRPPLRSRLLSALPFLPSGLLLHLPELLQLPLLELALRLSRAPSADFRFGFRTAFLEESLVAAWFWSSTAPCSFVDSSSEPLLAPTSNAFRGPIVTSQGARSLLRLP